MKQMLTLIALPIAALTLAACGSTSGTATDTNTTGSSSFNKADVTFAQDMVPHHQQAVQMAQLAKSRASGTKVKAFAAQIEEAQGPEIATMTGWLNAWGQQVPSIGSHMGGTADSPMPGMMSNAEMEKLGALSGATFDQMFLSMMVGHHDGAIEMAKAEQSDGKNVDAVSLAKKIETDQAAQIAEMNKMLQS